MNPTPTPPTEKCCAKCYVQINDFYSYECGNKSCSCHATEQPTASNNLSDAEVEDISRKNPDNLPDSTDKGWLARYKEKFPNLWRRTETTGVVDHLYSTAWPDVRDFIRREREEDRRNFLKILEENRNETLWGDEDSNEVMRVSIDNFIVAVKDDLAALETPPRTT